MGDEVISTIPAREINEFIKSSVDDLVPIPRESELTLDSTDLEFCMPIDLPLPCTDVLGDAIVDIDLLLGEHLDTLSTGDREIDFNPIRDIEELERLLADDPVPVPRVFDEPLGNSDSVPRSYDVTFSNPLFNFNDDFTLCNDNPLFDEEFKDISSLDPLVSTPVIDESTLLVTLSLSCTNVLGDVIVEYCSPFRDPRLHSSTGIRYLLGNPDSVSRSLETSDLILEEQIGLDDLIPTEIDDGYYDSEVLPKESTLLVTPLPDPNKQICLKGRWKDLSFLLPTQSGGNNRKANTSEFTTTTSQPSQLLEAKDKGKAKMIDTKKPLKNKDQILIDEEIAQKLQAQLNAELEEEEKLTNQKEEDANIVEWDNVQAMIDADYELAARL
ncbi:hypothetical protein Tco_1209896 [Tanacetum coccineum]